MAKAENRNAEQGSDAAYLWFGGVGGRWEVPGRGALVTSRSHPPRQHQALHLARPLAWQTNFA
jgi:hypothetical protein